MRRTVDFKRKQKVIVVDDKYEHASGVRELVNLENDYEVIANAGNANVAISLIDCLKSFVFVFSFLISVNLWWINGWLNITTFDILITSLFL